jgi:threonine dehydrogenase-like Zn-dependent dehydrogenase
MRALAWQGRRDVRVETVPDPEIREPSDAIVRITSTAICGSDLYLYEVLGPYLKPGDILGHEPMGIVEEIGAEVIHIRPGDRVVVPFNACARRDDRLVLAARSPEGLRAAEQDCAGAEMLVYPPTSPTRPRSTRCLPPRPAGSGGWTRSSTR